MLRFMPARRKRILLVAHALTPWQMELWREVSKHVDLHVVGAVNAPNVDSFPRAVEKPDFGSVHLLTAKGRLWRGHTWWWYQGLLGLIRQIKPDLVHVASEPWGLLSHEALLSRRPVVLHGVENIWDQGSAHQIALRSWLTRRALQRAAGFVSWNTEGIANAAAYGLSASKPTLLCPFTISPSEPYAAQREVVWGRAEGRPIRIGFAGRLVVEKGLDWLIDAMAIVRTHGIDVILQVAGAGPHLEAIRSHAEKAGVPLDLLGSIPTEELPSIMGQWDIAAVPSLTLPTWKEQFGRSAVEAMMCGLPTIVSDSGALPEVVATAGTIVAESNTQALADAIEKLCDPVVRISVGKAVAKHVDATYNPAVLTEALLRFWDKTLGLTPATGMDGPKPA